MSISDNSKFHALVPESGTEFKAGQKIIFEVKPSISFIKGRESYLTIDLENTSSNRLCGHPFNTIGVAGLIQRLDIFSLQNGQLLESLVDLNKWSNIENQYLNSNNNQLDIKEGCVEPLTSFINGCDPATKVLSKTAEGLTHGWAGVSRLSTINTDGNTNFMPHKFILPLRSGIFNHFGVDEKLTPNLLFGGMRLEFTCADNETPQRTE